MKSILDLEQESNQLLSKLYGEKRLEFSTRRDALVNFGARAVPEATRKQLFTALIEEMRAHTGAVLSGEG